MYQNHEHRPSTRKPKSFTVRLDPIPISEQVAYVQSVCATLIDSRFGHGSSTAFIIDLGESPEFDLDVFCDLMDAAPVRDHTLPACRRGEVRYRGDEARSELARVDAVPAVVWSQRRSPSTLGRGSPKYPIEIRAISAKRREADAIVLQDHCVNEVRASNSITRVLGRAGFDC